MIGVFQSIKVDRVLAQLGRHCKPYKYPLVVWDLMGDRLVTAHRAIRRSQTQQNESLAQKWRQTIRHLHLQQQPR